jgi:hypothetical protein
MLRRVVVIITNDKSFRAEQKRHQKDSWPEWGWFIGPPRFGTFGESTWIWTRSMQEWLKWPARTTICGWVRAYVRIIRLIWVDVRCPVLIIFLLFHHHGAVIVSLHMIDAYMQDHHWLWWAAIPLYNVHIQLQYILEEYENVRVHVIL